MSGDVKPDVLSQRETKKSLADVIIDRSKKVSEISALIASTYNVEVSDGKLSDAAIAALAETLVRLPPGKLESTPIRRSRFATPENLYLWAIANADVVFPYLSLKQAEEHLKISLYAPQPWGIREDKVHLPRVETITPDSRTWILLVEMLRSLFGEENVLHDSDAIETVPTLSNDFVDKNSTIKTVLIRMMELVKNPLSCTIRKDGLEKGETIARNAVDFVLIDEIYQRDARYKNLTLSGVTVSSGRRSLKVPVKGTGNKISYSNTFQGYRLSEILSEYIEKKNSKEKALEHEPFVALFLAFLRKLVPRELTEYELPKHIFESPSHQLRAMVREGPMIKTKAGMRHNLYVPFSFVKSTECASYPEVTRKELVDLGGDVLKRLDEVNKNSVTYVNEILPVVRDYLSLVYTLSDTIRKAWRTKAFVPDTAQLRRVVIDDYDLIDSESKDSLTSKEYLIKLKNLFDVLKLKPAKTSESEQKEILASVQEILSQRRAAKTAASRR